jgi:hypothetical protein
MVAGTIGAASVELALGRIVLLGWLFLPAMTGAALGASLVQAVLLRGRLARPAKWALITFVGGAFAIVASQLLLQHAGALVWFIVGPFCAAPLVLAQWRLLPHGAQRQRWLARTVVLVAAAPPIAVASAMSIATALPPAEQSGAVASDPALLFAVAVALGLAWVVASVPTALLFGERAATQAALKSA